MLIANRIGVQVMLLVSLALDWSPSGAASLNVTVTDNQGKPIEDAVVYVEAGPPVTLTRPGVPAEIEQKARKFIPLVTVVQTGGAVSFPNRDSVRHHVYSYSPAKVFDIKLYSGVPPEPQIFDKPGTVVLGCNIHDQMIAYVQVVSTPYFSKSDAAGVARLTGLPAQRAKLKVWHYDMAQGAVFEQEIAPGNNDGALTVKLSIKRSSGN